MLIDFLVFFRCKTQGLFRNVKISRSTFNRIRLLYGLEQIRGTKEFPINIKSSNLVGNIAIEYGTNCFKSHLNSSLKGQISIGRFNSINGTYISAGDARVSIASFCSIAEGVKMLTSGHDKNRLTTYYINKHLFKSEDKNEVYIRGDIVIEEDVWIGANVIILGGVTIGRGAVVAAGSVVTKDIPPYTIAGGVPSKKIDYRFSVEIVKKIEESRWWTWDTEKLRINSFLFKDALSEDILNKIEK